jgi:hypothetical protein
VDNPRLDRIELAVELVPEALIASCRVSICTIASLLLSAPPTEGMFDRLWVPVLVLVAVLVV